MNTNVDIFRSVFKTIAEKVPATIELCHKISSLVIEPLAARREAYRQVRYQATPGPQRLFLHRDPSPYKPIATVNPTCQRSRIRIGGGRQRIQPGINGVEDMFTCGSGQGANFCAHFRKLQVMTLLTGTLLEIRCD